MNVHLEEVWLGPVRLQGRGQIQGGFLLHPRTRVGISPAQFSFAKGTHVSLGNVVFSEDMSLGLSGSLAVTEFGGATKLTDQPPLLAGVHAQVEVDGSFRSFAAFEPLLPKLQQLRVTSGAGQLSLRAALDQGQLQPGFSFKLDSGRVRLTAPQVDPPVTVAGPFALRVNAQDGTHVAARMDWSQVRLSYLKDKSKDLDDDAPRLKHLQVNGNFTLDQPPLSAHFKGGRVLVEGLELPELSFFTPLLEGTPIELRRGHGVLNAEVDIPEDLAARGQIKTKLLGVLLHTDEVQLDFSAGLEGQLSIHPKTGRLSIQPLTLIAEPLHVVLDGERIPWQFRLTTGNTSLDLTTGNKVSDVALHGPSLQPFLDVLIKNGFVRALGKSVLAQGGTEARLRFTQSKSTTRLDLLAFKSGRMAVDGVLMTDRKHLLGAFLLIGDVVRVGVVVPPGKGRVHPTASRRWLEKELERQGIPPVPHERVKPGRKKKEQPTR